MGKREFIITTPLWSRYSTVFEKTNNNYNNYKVPPYIIEANKNDIINSTVDLPIEIQHEILCTLTLQYIRGYHFQLAGMVLTTSKSFNRIFTTRYLCERGNFMPAITLCATLHEIFTFYLQPYFMDDEYTTNINPLITLYNAGYGAILIETPNGTRIIKVGDLECEKMLIKGTEINGVVVSDYMRSPVILLHPSEEIINSNTFVNVLKFIKYILGADAGVYYRSNRIQKEYI